MRYKVEDARLKVYAEVRKQRIYVGLLEYLKERKSYRFTYDSAYLDSAAPLALGVDLPCSRKVHESDALFLSFVDRIPSRENPAYRDYCRQRRIPEDETNEIILLGAIGTRGPSCFIFELIWHCNFDVVAEFNALRRETGLSLNTLSKAFNLNYATLHRLITGKSKDPATTRILRYLLTVPECMKQELRLTRAAIHHDAFVRLLGYAEAADKRAETAGRTVKEPRYLPYKVWDEGSA